MDLVFPFGGLDRSKGHQREPPYSSRRIINCMPRDMLGFEQRGGARCGMIRGKDEAGTPDITGAVNLLNTIDVVEANKLDVGPGQAHWFDSFRGTALDTAVWTPLAGETLPEVIDEQFAAAVYSGGAVTRSAMRALPADFNLPQPTALPTVARLVVGIFIAPWRGRHWGKYRLFLFADNTTPAPFTNGFVFELDLTGSAGSWSGTASGYEGGVLDGSAAFSGALPAKTMAGWFHVAPFDTGAGLRFQVNFNGRDIGNPALTTLNPSAGIITAGRQRTGFGMVAEDAGGRTQVDAYRLDYQLDVERAVVRTRLLVNGPSKFMRLGNTQLFEPLTGIAHFLNFLEPLESTEFLQNLYIADHSEVFIHEIDGAIDVGGKFVSATVGDFTSFFGTTEEDYVIRIEGYGDFSIASYATVQVTLRENWAQPANGTTNLVFRIFRGPKLYNGPLDRLEPWSAAIDKGTLPANCRGVSRHGESLVLFGDPEAPNNIFYSRAGDPTDFLFAQDDEDPEAPFASNSTTMATIGEPVRCFISATDDVSFIGTTKSILQLSGPANPVAGGQYAFVSRDLGIVGARAYCRTPDGQVLAMTQDGIYVLVPNARPARFSREFLPDELLELDGNVFNVMLAFDIRFGGVWILIVDRFGAAGRHFWLDWSSKRFYQVKFGTADIEPTSVTFYKAANSEDGGVWFGCRDGKLRRPHRLAIDDDAVALESEVMIGPLQLGRDDRQGLIRALRGELPAESSGVDWSIHVADTPEAALEAAAFTAGAFAAGLGRHVRPRARGRWMYLRLAGDQTLPWPWALEKVMLERETRGALHRV